MRIRTLVPALACLAAAPFAAAADSVPAVKLDGFVDTVLYGTSTIDSDADNTTDNDSNSGFAYAAKLGVAATISEKVSAQVDAFIDGDTISSSGDDSITIRQAYGTWKVTDEVELKTGKFISNYGWVAAYAPGLYRVNTGPITTFYGVDQIGADVKVTKGDFTGALTVANGFFNEDYNSEAQSGSGQKNEAYAIGLDGIFALGSNGSVNAEVVYDMDINNGGDGIHFGLNATLTPNEQLTAGVELIMQQQAGADDTTQEDQTNLGLMGMVNFKLGSALAVPASVTGMVQYVSVENIDYVKDDNASQLELSLALLTNPAGTDKLGANFEIYAAMNEDESASAKAESTEVGVAAELLYVF